MEAENVMNALRQAKEMTSLAGENIRNMDPDSNFYHEANEEYQRLVRHQLNILQRLLELENE